MNLIIPLGAHAFLTICVFYLPSGSREKVALCINIFFSLTVFFLLLREITPPSSLVVPMLGKYLIFTLVIVTTSVIVTSLTLNIHFRAASQHMPAFLRKFFIYWMPRILMMTRPKIENSHDLLLKNLKINVCSCMKGSNKKFNRDSPNSSRNYYSYGSHRSKTQVELIRLSEELESGTANGGRRLRNRHFRHGKPTVRDTIESAIYIADHLKEEDDKNRVSVSLS